MTIRIMYVHFILMRVTIEYTTDGITETSYNTIIFTRPDVPTGTVARGNVSQNMYIFIVLFGIQEDIMQPHQLGLHVRTIKEEPPVIGVTIVIVQSYNTETRLNQYRIVTALENSGLSIGRQVSGPYFVDVFIERFGTNIVGYIVGREPRRRKKN